ncbi:Hypothetical protein POVR1_LOCUS54 [uncultured virus]|nr:Hypothetical protein POVR1_LOCUS54 [uncultured virus]
MSKKTAVLYTFHIIKPQLQHYINSSFEAKDVDFYLIPCGIDLKGVTVPDHMKILPRANKGYDFGAWSDALLNDELYKRYTHFIFINCSVAGPFTPSYFQGRWTDLFIDPLNDQVKLFGTTINTISQVGVCAHVQSFVFSMDREALELLITKRIFTQKVYCRSILQTVACREVRMSREIIKAGWNIGCMLRCYRGIDFRTVKHVIVDGDVCYPNRYFGQTTHPYEVVFVKANRGQNLTWLAIYED